MTAPGFWARHVRQRLVQTVYPLKENTGLALTTAQYYTPSGRLIQRDYSNISFLDYYYGKRTEAKNLQDVKRPTAAERFTAAAEFRPTRSTSRLSYNTFQIELYPSTQFFNLRQVVRPITIRSCQGLGPTRR